MISNQAKDILLILWSAIASTLTTVIMAVMGATITYHGLLDAKAMKGISAMVKDVAVPCLLFYRVGQSISVDNIVKWAPVPVYAICNTLFGCALGYMVARISCLSPAVTRFVMVSVGFTNTNTIALAFMQVLPYIEPDRLKYYDDDLPSTISARGQAFVLLFNMSVTFLRWTLADRMLEPKKSDIEDQKKKEEREIVGSGARELTDVSAAKESFPVLTKKAKCKHYVQKVLGFFPIPLWVCFIAVGIGLSPLKKYFFTVPGEPTPPLLFFSSAVDYVGQTVAPLMNFVLGSKLVKGPPKNHSLNNFLLMLIAWLKLVVVPLLFGVGLVYFAGYHLSSWIHDPTMLFVLLLESANPPALLLLLMCTANNFMVEEITALIFYSYMFSVITLTLFCFLFLLLI